ncbi:MAG: adenylate/guanylate cyclase domain-containing protein [Pseudomonadota bacterium]
MSASLQAEHAILFADVVGSTSLYETLGDEAAKQAIVALENHMAHLVVVLNGMVVETVGDEIMCRFQDAAAAVSAACALQAAVVEHSTETGSDLMVRIGLHCGPAIFEGGRMFGDTVNTAARMASIAHRCQIITSKHTVDQLPAELRQKARRFDTVKVKGKAEEMVIYDIPWRSEDLTQMRTEDAAADLPAPTAILVMLGDQTYRLERGSDVLRIGRDPSNDIVIRTHYASRFHARVECVRDRFVIADSSTNGTYVTIHQQPMVYLRREHLPLWSNGRIGIGHPALSTDEYCLHFATD